MYNNSDTINRTDGGSRMKNLQIDFTQLSDKELEEFREEMEEAVEKEQQRRREEHRRRHACYPH